MRLSKIITQTIYLYIRVSIQMPKLQMPSSCGGERTHAEYRLLFYKDVLIYSSNGRTSKKLQQAKEARQKEKHKVWLDNSYTEILSCKLSTQRLESVVTEERAQSVPHAARMRMFRENPPREWIVGILSSRTKDSN